MKQLYYDTGGVLPAGKIIEVEPEELEEEEQRIITKNASDDNTS